MSDYRFTAVFDGDDEPMLITATPRDQLAWEAQSPDRAIGMVATGWATGTHRVTDMYSLSHAAAKRQGLFAGDLTEWKERVTINAGHHPKLDPVPEGQAEGEDQKAEVDDTGEVPTNPAP